MKRILIILAIILTAVAVNAQTSGVKWYTIEEAEKLVKASPRPVFIDTYTDWCGWCKKMDKETFTNPVIAQILNTKFYAVKFDAESAAPVNFQGKKFVNDGKSGRAHQLAVALLNGQLSYPTVVFLNEQLQLLTPAPGFREPKDMEVLLSYFSDKAYEKQNFQDYQKTFKSNIK